MRWLGLLALLPTAAFAGDGFAGTKKTVVTSPVEAAGGIAPVLQMLVALAIVCVALKWVMPKLVGKVNKRIVTSANGGIAVEESAQFAGGSLYVVRARSKTLLLCSGTQGVVCLADISEPKPVEAPTFMEMLEVKEQAPARDPADFATVVVETGEETPLDRLNRFLA